MTPPVEPQPGPDFAKGRRVLDALAANDHTVAEDLLRPTLTATLRTILYAAESALLRAAETERELREEIAGLKEQNEWLSNQVMRYDEYMRTELARAEQDTARLDWCEKHGDFGYKIEQEITDMWLLDLPLARYATVREAIDAARLAAPQDHQEGESSGD